MNNSQLIFFPNNSALNLTNAELTIPSESFQMLFSTSHYSTARAGHPIIHEWLFIYSRTEYPSVNKHTETDEDFHIGQSPEASAKTVGQSASASAKSSPRERPE